MTVTSTYRHENQNSIYYLKPESQAIYILNFKLQYFCEERLKWKRGNGKIPYGATSQQTTDASIFVIGGATSNRSDAAALPDCLQIDANLTVYD